MKAIPTIQKFMTYVPKSIEANHTIAEASELMSSLNLRHLPVLRGGKLAGILTDRDIKLVLGFKGVDATTTTVDLALHRSLISPCQQRRSTKWLPKWQRKKSAGALIVDNDQLVGIFTETDAYKALAELLETRLKQ